MDNASVNKVLKRIIMDIVDRVIILKEGVFSNVLEIVRKM